MIANQSTPFEHEPLKQLASIADALERAYPNRQDQQLDPDVIAFKSLDNPKRLPSWTYCSSICS
ncbi:hypothetical protein SAMN05216206_2502 [Pseudomonas guineae]|uniref:Uncharacterized protein n=1 Tax=Pseudomonas guineae TaxID=425504 RepID=A0A1I3JH51_9PSED|nr:hypothetical protein SAMN05216206_2502 [Pseudomonas guineae]